MLVLKKFHPCLEITITKEDVAIANVTSLKKSLTYMVHGLGMTYGCVRIWGSVNSGGQPKWNSKCECEV